LWALILPGMLVGFNLILMKNFMESIPQSLEEAAKIDGASDLYILFRIVLPLSTPILATLGLFIAVTQWNSYFHAVIYIRDNHKWTLQLLLREIIMSASMVDNQLEADKYVMPETIKYASLIVVMLPIMCVYPFLQKYFVKGIMVGAVKG
jgi:putative aldouronate transport system permease protein